MNGIATDIDSPSSAADLTGRVAIVTGAFGGIGRATAGLLARAGATVVCVDSNPGITGINDPGCTGVVVDVTSQSAVQALVEKTFEQYGRLDVMVNNAGIITNATLAELDETELDRTIAVNLKGVLFGCKAAAAVMTRQGSGSIVNLASEAIYTAVPNILAYSITKAAVAQLTRCVASEVGPSGVRVNAVAPGFIETPMTSRHFTSSDGVVDQEKRKVVLAEFTKGIASTHVGQPIDIAHTILFLASDASRYTVGQIIRTGGNPA